MDRLNLNAVYDRILWIIGTNSHLEYDDIAALVCKEFDWIEINDAENMIQALMMRIRQIVELHIYHPEAYTQSYDFGDDHLGQVDI